MGVLQEAGYDVEDVSYAILTYDDGAVVNLGVSYALPEKYPALGHAARVEVLGTGGVMILDDDHTDQLMYSENRRAARLSAGPQRQHGVPAKRHAGRLGAGRILGPIANETRAWLDHSPSASRARWRRRRTRAPRWRRPWRSTFDAHRPPVTLPLRQVS